MRLYLETESGRTDVASWRTLSRLCRETADMTGELHALAAICDLPGGEFSDISSIANRLNSALAEERARTIDYEVKQVLAARIAAVMEKRIGEGGATDRSRPAWLYLRMDSETKAIEHIQAGLKLDPDNTYCLSLAERLGMAS